MLQRNVQVPLFALIMMILGPAILCVAVEEHVRKDTLPQQSSSEFCFYEHAPSGAIITQARITTQLNEDYSSLEPSLQPTTKEIVAKNLVRDRVEFQEGGLIGYLNRDSKAKVDEASFLEIIGFSDEEIEKLLAPIALVR